ncbi:ABC transporter substrate-binding protein [Streptomyces sp. 4N509B]|uniref:ABC transporter substrate-binding protein n=1 Tax=Streptomyces sp. 4N509B TaxID=3457413 RepID=UPI003FD5A1F2
MSLRRSATRGLAIAVVGSLALAACGSDGGGGDDNGKVTLNFTWWGADERASRYEQVVDLFEEQHPNITVQTSFAEFPDYWTQRSTDATGGGLPDVMQMDNSYIQEYANNGLLYDMGPHVGQELDASQIDENVLTAGVVNDQQVGIPVSTNTLAMLVNVDLLDQLGVEVPDWDYTWQEYNDFISEVTAAGADSDPRVYGAGDYTIVWWMFVQYLLQEGVQPFAENNEWNFTEDHLHDFLALADGIRYEDMFPAERLDQLDPLGAFNSGEAPTEFTWDNFLAGYGAELETDNLELMPVPTGSDGSKHMFFKPSMQYSIGANTEHPEEAAMLIDFLVNDTEAGQIIGTDLGVPASQGRLDALEVEPGSFDEKVIEYERRVAEEGYMTEETPIHAQGFGAVENEYVEIIGNEFSYGTIDAEEFVSRVFDSLETNIVTQ